MREESNHLFHVPRLHVSHASIEVFLSSLTDSIHLHESRSHLDHIWHPSTGFTASQIYDPPHYHGLPRTFTESGSFARPHRHRRPPASAIPSHCPPQCRSCSCSRPLVRSRRFQQPSRTRDSTPQGRPGCHERRSTQACRPR